MPDNKPPGVTLSIDIANQLLTLATQSGDVIARYLVSTGLNGPGQADGSGCTPTGEHYVRARIGAGQPVNTVYRGRRPTGEIYSQNLAETNPGRDWILTRILWLCGCEWGRNRGPGVDTFRRFIYIHGTPDSEPMGVARSHGCIRMRNTDIVELFDRVPAGTPVRIY